MNTHGEGAAWVAAGYVNLHDLPMTWAESWRVWPNDWAKCLDVDQNDTWYAPGYMRDGRGPKAWFVASPDGMYSVADLFEAVRPMLVSHAEWERDPLIAQRVLSRFFAMSPALRRDRVLRRATNRDDDD